MSLADFLNSVDEQDEEITKLAAEEEAAGRIMARGFMDELNKLAQQMPKMPAPPPMTRQPTAPPKVPEGSIVQPGRKAGLQRVQKRQQRLYR